MIGRSGHLTDLAIDRYLHGELGDAADEHLGGCEACRRRVDEARAFDAAVVVLPPRGKRARWWPAAVAGAVAAAAAVVLAVGSGGSGPRGDGLRAKGGAFHVEVHAHDGARSRRLATGDAVRPGERLGFRVQARDAGYLLIVGHDARDHLYVCYPQDTRGAAARVEPAARPRAVDQAVRLDDVPGRESIHAVFCPRPFTLADVAPASGSGPPSLPAGCTRQIYELEKQP